MNPKIFETNLFIIDPYYVFFLLAWTIGFVIFFREVKRRNWNVENMMVIAAGSMLGAVIGMLFLSAVIFGRSEVLEQIAALNFSGMSVLGGITGGFLGVEITKKIIGYSRPTGDAFALAIPIAHAVGRLGCYFAGCCYGGLCSLPWALQYPQMSPAYADHLQQGLITNGSAFSLPVHPIPVYEIVFNLILFGIIWKNRDRFTAVGALFRVYLISFCSFRFLEEFIRVGTGDVVFIGLKPVQIYLLIAIIYFSKWLYDHEFRKFSVKPVYTKDER